jgi:hypothetical protein
VGSVVISNDRLHGMGLQAYKLKPWIFLAVGIAAGIFFANRFLCSNNVITHTDTIYDTITYNIPTPVPVPDTVIIHTPFPVEVIEYDTILTPPDTIYILGDYYKERIYRDTIQDARLRAYLNETVQMNRISHRDFSYQILSPTEVITSATNYLHGGLLLYYTGENAGFAPMVNYTNQRFTVGVAYDFIRRGVFVQSGLTLFKW